MNQVMMGQGKAAFFLADPVPLVDTALPRAGWVVEVFGTEGVWIGQGMEEELVLLGG